MVADIMVLDLLYRDGIGHPRNGPPNDIGKSAGPYIL